MPNMLEHVYGEFRSLIRPQLLEGMLVHPYSKETVQMFLRDAAEAEKML